MAKKPTKMERIPPAISQPRLFERPSAAARIPRPFGVCNREGLSSRGGTGIALSLGNSLADRSNGVGSIWASSAGRRIGLHWSGQRSEARWSVMIRISSFRARSRTLDRLGGILDSLCGRFHLRRGSIFPFRFLRRFLDGRRLFPRGLGNGEGWLMHA